ncbi:chemotaxis protein CheW [Bacillus sp. T3]|uniref:chemotaxis protein CheW n=1 Tax=Bacillus sp. T3 TaxID=467262 RepID=UPI0029828316|nr:chemotaxis protein CheW [Bacillus sp. T3]
MDTQTFEQDLKTLVFRVGKEHYGIHINQVVSIERMQSITPYPNRPPYVLGVTTVREEVIPVVDLCAALTGESFQHEASSRIIIVQVYGNAIGLLVDAATDVLDIAADIIQKPNLFETREVTYLKGIAKQEERLLILLDIEKLLEDTTNLDDLKEIKNYL